VTNSPRDHNAEADQSRSYNQAATRLVFIALIAIASVLPAFISYFVNGEISSSSLYDGFLCGVLLLAFAFATVFHISFLLSNKANDWVRGLLLVLAILIVLYLLKGSILPSTIRDSTLFLLASAAEVISIAFALIIFGVYTSKKAYILVGSSCGIVFFVLVAALAKTSLFCNQLRDSLCPD